MAAGRWSADELERRALLEQGMAVAVNMRRHRDLVAWAKELDLFVRVDRATPWCNPFMLGRDGHRTTVIAKYRDDHLPSRPDLLARLGEMLGGRVLVRAAGVPCGRARETSWRTTGDRQRPGDQISTGVHRTYRVVP